MKKNAKIIRQGISAVVVITAITFFYSLQQQGQKSEITPENLAVNYWEMFAGISVERKFVEEADAYYRLPIFTPMLEAYTGKEVTLTGYYLPYSQSDSVIIISRFPNASCFFCGRAGIESVAMVELKKAAPKLYRTDQRLTVTGKLMLNSTNYKKLAFVIEDASAKKLRRSRSPF